VATFCGEHQFMKNYEPPLRINIFVRFILALTGALVVLVCLAGIFGEANLILNGENLNQSNSIFLRIVMLIIMLFVGVSCFLVLESMKYSLACLGLGVLSLLALSFFHLNAMPNSEVFLSSIAINYVIFLAFPVWLFYLEFKRAKYREKI
jgi:hypothetical protein